jgi:hypothetical protein
MKRARNLLLQDKKGVSLMIGYVLLIIIAISLSIAVYAFLVLYLPSEEPGCPEDIKIIVNEVSCIWSSGDGKWQIEVSVTNKGLFGIDGIFIRVGDKDRIYKEVVNEDDEEFLTGGGLPPGEEETLGPYNLEDWTEGQTTPPTNYEIEIEPFIFELDKSNKPQLCSHNLVTKNLIC